MLFTEEERARKQEQKLKEKAEKKAQKAKKKGRESNPQVFEQRETKTLVVYTRPAKMSPENCKSLYILRSTTVNVVCATLPTTTINLERIG